LIVDDRLLILIYLKTKSFRKNVYFCYITFRKNKILVLDLACCVIITTRSRMKTFSPYNLPHSIPFNPRRVDSAAVYLKRGGELYLFLYYYVITSGPRAEITQTIFK